MNTHAASTPRPLVSRSALLALSVGALAALLLLWPLAKRRQQLASSLAPTALSLAFLRASVHDPASDRELRFTLVQKTLAAGLFDDARQQLSLLEGPGERGARVAMLRVELEHAAWAAVDPDAESLRSAALARLRASMQQVEPSLLDTEQAERLSELSLHSGGPSLCAELLDMLARRGLPDSERRIGAADRAWLLAAAPLRAAQLHTFAALGASDAVLGAEHARLAIERARSAEQPTQERALLQALLSRYPRESGLLERALALARGSDNREAFALAARLLELDESNPRRHRELAELAEWTGQSLRALDEYVWLVRHGGTRRDHARAIALAKANWDLPLLLELKEARPLRDEKGRRRPRCERSRGCARGPSAVSRRPLPQHRRCGRDERRDVRRARRRMPNDPSDSATPSARDATRAIPPGERTTTTRPATTRQPAGRRLEPAPARRDVARSKIAGSEADLLERIALHEALGEDQRALALLRSAISRLRPADREAETLYRLEVALELRSGQLEAAAASWSRLAARFPQTLRDRQQRADLLLALGRSAEALEVLLAAAAPYDAQHLRAIADLASELGDRARLKRALHQLVRQDEAKLDDFERLWWLERQDRHDRAALEVAERGFARFAALSMLDHARISALARGDQPSLRRLMRRLERFAPRHSNDPDYWKLRAEGHADMADAMLREGLIEGARDQVEAAGRALHRQRTLASAVGETHPNTGVMAASTRLLGLALAVDHRALAQQVYRDVGAHLPLQQRVDALHRLGQDEQAIATAIAREAGEALTDSERDTLESDTRWLAGRSPRRVSFAGHSTNFGRLAAARGGVSAEYTTARMRFGLALEFTTLDARRSDLQLAGEEEWSVLVRGAFSQRVALDLGFWTRTDGGALPRIALSLGLLGDDGERLKFALRVDDVPDESAALRALGMRHVVELSTRLAIDTRWQWNARATATAYTLRADRSVLGAGVLFDSALARSFELPEKLGSASLRVASYYAGRATERRAGFVPEDTLFVGLGAGLMRGELGVPPVIGRELSILLDGSAGWLLLQRRFGWSARAGLGASLLGRDQLALFVRAGNVIGNAEGTAFFEGGLSYTTSLWR